MTSKWLGGKDDKDDKPSPNQDLPGRPRPGHDLPTPGGRPRPNHDLPDCPDDAREPRPVPTPLVTPAAQEVLVMDQASLREWRDRVYLGGPSSAEWEEFDAMVPVVDEEPPVEPPLEGGELIGGVGVGGTRGGVRFPPGRTDVGVSVGGSEGPGRVPSTPGSRDR
jgi:hypothetical protein